MSCTESSQDISTVKMNSNYFERRALNCEKVRPRKINFKFNNNIPCLWLDNSIVMTHFFNAINLYVPAFESFMARIMRSELQHIQGEEHFKNQILGFIAQEISHGETHRKYNQVLENMGYKFKVYLKCADYIFGNVLEKKLGAHISLATIAGFEHLTAILTYIILDQNVMKNATPIMKDLWEWHAAEEVEHEYLAYQFLQKVNNSYRLRAIGLILGALVLMGFTFSGMLILVSQEQRFISRRTFVDLYKLLLGENKVISKVFKLSLEYLRPGDISPHHISIPSASKVLSPV